LFSSIQGQPLSRFTYWHVNYTFERDHDGETIRQPERFANIAKCAVVIFSKLWMYSTYLYLDVWCIPLLFFVFS
jgi:hypothetical protein